MSGSNRPRGRSPLKLYHIEMRELAHEDIAAIGIFIAQSHPFNAQRYVDRLYDSMLKLKRLPKAHPAAPSIYGLCARRMRVGSHYVLYLVSDAERSVEVIRVVHVKEDPRRHADGF